MDFKYVKIITILSVIILIISYLTSFLITKLFGDKNFTIFLNAVSDLGQKLYSPLPLLFDLGCIFSGILMFPFIFNFFLSFLFKLEINFTNIKHKIFYRALAILAFSFLLNGNIGLVGVGIFSLDRNPFYLHYVFAFFLFIGYPFFAFFIRLIYLIYKISIPSYLLISGFVYFITFLVLLLMAYVYFPVFATLFEWILVFVIYSWFFLFSLTFIYRNNA